LLTDPPTTRTYTLSLHDALPIWRTARLRRLRRGRRPDRGGAAAAVPGDPVRRDREGAPGRVQHAVAAARRRPADGRPRPHRGLRSEEHTSELQSRGHLVCRLLLE